LRLVFSFQFILFLTFFNEL